MITIEKNWKRIYKFYVRDVLILTRRFIIVQFFTADFQIFSSWRQ
jgi:hypothetical protein